MALNRKEYMREWRKKNAEKVYEYNVRYNGEHPEWRKNANSSYYYENREAILERASTNHKKNAEHNRQRSRAYKKADPAGNCERAARYKTKKRGATPPWLTDRQIIEMRRMYSVAKELSDLTGVQFQVDHIVPLQGKSVSGLHVPWNLQILPYYENISKGNRCH